jgi:hypothetical protein
MRYERSNDAFLRVAFALMQMVLILVVYGFVYTTMLVVRETATQAAYLVPVAVMLALPYGFWRFRKLFAKGKRTEAAVWSIALSGVAIIILSVFSVNLAGV